MYSMPAWQGSLDTRTRMRPRLVKEPQGGGGGHPRLAPECKPPAVHTLCLPWAPGPQDTLPGQGRESLFTEGQRAGPTSPYHTTPSSCTTSPGATTEPRK